MTRLYEPITPDNTEALVTWAIAEGGHYQNDAHYNLLNTKRDVAGSWWIEGNGARAYPTYEAGMQATVETFENGLYGSILGALNQGGDVQGVLNAAVHSHWAESHYSNDKWNQLRAQAREQIATAHC